MKKSKIFISAYACEPNLGSEIGVGWHWVLEMSKYFHLWVLTRKSNQKNIEKWISNHPEYDNIHFLYFDLPHYLRFWKKGMRGVRTYYHLWQWCTNRIVKRTMQKNGIPIYHHLTYGNALWSVSAYGQKQFFVWGPIGGLETIPQEYTQYYPLKGKIIESVRRMVIATLKINAGFNKRCKNANLILCKTEATRNRIPLKERKKAILFTDVAVEKGENSDANYSANKATKFLAVGNLDAWRGFDLLIEAFEKAVKKNSDIHLTILGKGAEWMRLNQMIEKKGLRSWIDMKGKVSMQTYQDTLNACDAVINPCLKEGAVTVSFDSMSKGKPLICIDTGGYTRYFSDDYAIVIPLRSREEVVHLLQQAIVKLTDVNIRENLGKAALQAGQAFSWENRAKEIYQTIVSAYSNRKP